ncbi:MAG: SDR family oxidoreductase [Rhodospirillaceae bacterium]|nr:SDR family oxidoreductase [Rhodospirillaceae bacterium]
MSQAKKIALVTGAGTGIGKAATLALAKDGFAVVLAGRRADKLEAVAKDCAAAGAEALAVPTDVTDEAAVQALYARIEERFGRLDVLFNNAGMNASAGIEDLDLAKWQAVVNVNLTAVFLCTREAFRLMKKQTPRGGRIINNGSISAHVPRPMTIAYTATKHAVTGMTRSTSLEGRAYDIACGQIDIGNAETELAARMKQGILQPYGAVVPEPMMDVAHVGSAVAYMASLPLDANVQFMTVMATKMPFIGRG